MRQSLGMWAEASTVGGATALDKESVSSIIYNMFGKTDSAVSNA